MSDHATFLSALRADPLDAIPRSVYADWLDERGDVRGEFLRLLPGMASEDREERSRTERRLEAIREELRDDWFRAAVPRVDRLRLGDGERVWEELVEAGPAVLEGPLAIEAEAVARETMHRVRRNTEVIVERLVQLGYQFAYPESVHVAPEPNVADELVDVEQEIGGPIPLSLRTFWEIVGSVNFAQSQEQCVHDWFDQPDSELERLGDDDPFWVRPLQNLRDGLRREHRSWTTSRRDGRVYFCFAPDCFHKANVSGGENYHVWLPDSTADFRIVGDVAPTQGKDFAGDFFVHYLRRSVLNGGFRGRLALPDEAATPSGWLPRRAILDSVAEGLEIF